MKVRNVTGGVWAIEQGLVNAYVVASDEPVVVDTGVARRVTDLIGGITQTGVDPPRVRHVVLTHYHRDHVGGLSRLQTIAAGSQTSVHPVDAPVVRGEAPHPEPVVGGLRGAVVRVIGPRVLGRPTPAVVHREILDGEEVVEGLRAVHTPGHTGGHLSYLWEPDGVLFVGDAAMNIRTLSPPSPSFTEDQALMRESLERIAGLSFEVAVFGHGSPLTDDAAGAFRRLAERTGSG